MDIKKRAELLKKFIEICDKEIFPANPLTVYVVNKSFINSTNTASYNNTDYFRMVMFTPVIFFSFIFTQMLFFIKRTLRQRKNLIIRTYRLRYIKIALDCESYFVTKHKPLLGMDAIHLASIACHEVRHRCQYRYGRKGIQNERSSNDLKLLELYESGRLKAGEKLALKAMKYNWELESDAYFIQILIKNRLVEKFSEEGLSISDFRIFIQENKKLLTWENPYLK